MAPSHAYLPTALRLSGRTVVVIGGDSEATAKVRKLLPLRCHLTVISAEVTPEIAHHAAHQDLRWIRRPYRMGDFQGAFLAFVCDAGCADCARREADRSGVLLNVLDREDLSDLIGVAFLDRSGLQIAVHTSGQSAALSRRIRERLEVRFADGYAELVQTLGALRPLVRAQVPSPVARRALWLETVDQRLLDEVEAGRFAGQAFARRFEAALQDTTRPGREEVGHA